MGLKTPDRSPGIRREEGIIMRDDGVDALQPGELRYSNGRWSMRDSTGSYDPRAGGAMPSPTQVGEVLYAKTPFEFTVELPLTDEPNGGWISDDNGILLVVG